MTISKSKDGGGVGRSGLGSDLGSGLGSDVAPDSSDFRFDSCISDIASRLLVEGFPGLVLDLEEMGLCLVLGRLVFGRVTLCRREVDFALPERDDRDGVLTDS